MGVQGVTTPFFLYAWFPIYERKGSSAYSLTPRRVIRKLVYVMIAKQPLSTLSGQIAQNVLLLLPQIRWAF